MDVGAGGMKQCIVQSIYRVWKENGYLHVVQVQSNSSSGLTDPNESLKRAKVRSVLGCSQQDSLRLLLGHYPS